MKRETKLLDGTSNNKSFWAIISGFDLHTSICERIDQALNIYLKGPQLHPVYIRVNLDIEQQFIRLEANSGGFVDPNLDLLIRPRGTTFSRFQSSTDLEM